MKIASLDVGIRTFNYCIQEIVFCNNEYLLSIFKEKQSQINNEIDNLIDNLNLNLIDNIRSLIDEIINYINYLNKPKIELTKWILKDLFPLSNDLEVLKCNNCNKKATFHCNNKKTKQLIGFCTKHSKLKYNDYTVCKKIEKRKIKKIGMFDITKQLIIELRNNHEILDCDHVIIEKQAGKFSARIGRVESFLFSYFIDHGVLNDQSNIKKVKIIHAKNKLNVAYDGPFIDCSHLKKPYDKRKYKGVKLMQYFLEKDCDTKNLNILQKNKSKQDDLCDNALMCRWYIEDNNLLK